MGDMPRGEGGRGSRVTVIDNVIENRGKKMKGERKSQRVERRGTAAGSARSRSAAELRSSGAHPSPTLGRGAGAGTASVLAPPQWPRVAAAPASRGGGGRGRERCSLAQGRGDGVRGGQFPASLRLGKIHSAFCFLPISPSFSFFLPVSFLSFALALSPLSSFFFSFSLYL